MGTGKVIRCKDCGHEWSIFKGVGMLGKKATKSKDKTNQKVCPNCKSTNIEETGVTFLWD